MGGDAGDERSHLHPVHLDNSTDAVVAALGRKLIDSSGLSRDTVGVSGEVAEIKNAQQDRAIRPCPKRE